MKSFYTYFLVDTLSETIISAFSAISDFAARKMVYEAIKKNPVYNDMSDSLRLFRTFSTFDVSETYDECTCSDYATEIDITGVFADA